MVKLTQISDVPSGVRYWFEEENRRDSEVPHLIQIIVNDNKIVDVVCSCIFGTIQLDSRKNNFKFCTHIKKSIEFLKNKKVLK